MDWCAQNPHCEENLGIPRSKMPQIATEDLRSFVEWLKSEGVTSRVGTACVGDLRATQKEIDPKKIESFLRDPEDTLMKPIMISGDDYVLDGHHRWAALLTQDPKSTIRTVQIDLPIRELLEKGHEFPGSFEAKNGESSDDKPRLAADALVLRYLIASSTTHPSSEGCK